MDAIEKFVCEQNVTRFRTRLETETDDASRSAVLRLLIAEESKLGSTSEQLAIVDRHIARCRELIVKQEGLIRNMRTNGHDVNRAEALLETLSQSLTLHENYRATIRDAIALIRA